MLGEISALSISPTSLENELIRSFNHLDCTGRIARYPIERDLWRSRTTDGGKIGYATVKKYVYSVPVEIKTP